MTDTEESASAPEPDDWWMGLVGRTSPKAGTSTAPDTDPAPPVPAALPTPPTAAAAVSDALLIPQPSTPPGQPIPPTPPRSPAAASSRAGSATGGPADDDQDDEDPLRFRGADLLTEWWRNRPKRAAQPEQPEAPDCPHARTVPVHARPTGEHVASICLDCDEQLDIPEPVDDEEPETKPAAPGKPGPGGKRRMGGRTPASKRPQNHPAAVGRSYVRPILFTLSAGAFGYSVGLVDALGGLLPAADHGATGTVGTFCSIAAGYGAWRVLGVPGVTGIVPFGLVGRALVTALVATAAPGLAPDLVELLDQYGVYIGLDASGTGLLATAGALCGGLYWLVDRRFRAMPWPVRWLVRIPLASAALAVALYGPGPR